ncbi:MULTISPECIES: DUF4358 domain-containing protein [Brevibacillus]|jgi:Domain of unknown function (DUF4358)|uniref:DUF4358 domain-containing protein n=2 Tax=Brevibacillus TaxID=55080 RepID=UPI000B0F0BA4
MMQKWLGKINAVLLVSMIACIVALSALTGCSGQNTEESQLAAAEIGDRIKQAVHLDDMKAGDAKKLQKLYKLGEEEVEDFILYTAPTNVRADEVAVLIAKDDSQAESIKAKIAERIEEQGKKFKDYVPDEYFLLEKHVLKTKGRYILLAVSKEAEKIESAFDEALK